MQANGNNGSGGNLILQATQLSIAGQIQANGNTGGTVLAIAQSSNFQSGSLIQANGNNGAGGAITLQTVDNQVISNAQLQVNGSGNGGNIQITTTSGDVDLQSALIQANGAYGIGGQIGIAATNSTGIATSTIEAIGQTQGGSIKLGSDTTNATLPLSTITSIDEVSVINASPIVPGETAGGYVETSGQDLSMLPPIIAGMGGTWLIDPSDVIIDVKTAANISTALNAGTNVTIRTTASTPTCSVTCTYIAGNGDITVSSAISKTTATGTPTLTLTAYRNVIINAAIGNTLGTLNLTFNSSGSGGISGNSSGSLSANGTLIFNVGGSGSGSLLGVVSAGSPTKQGSGTLTLSGNNAYSGRTTISAGTLKYGSRTGISSTSTVNMYDPTNGASTGPKVILDLNGFSPTIAQLIDNVNSNNPLDFIQNSSGTLSTLTINNSNGSGYFHGIIQDGDGAGGGGAVALIKSGTGGTYTGFSGFGISTFSGGTTITGGSIFISNATDLGTGAVINNSVLSFYGNSNKLGQVDFNRNISGTGQVQIGVNGGISDVQVKLSGNNSYTGGTYIKLGKLTLGSATALGTPSYLYMTADTVLDLNGQSLTVGALNNYPSTSVGGSILNSLPASFSTLTIGGGVNSTFGGVIQDGAGKVALIKRNPDILTLTGSNTYSGGTTVNAGTLSIASGGVSGTNLSTSVVTINGGTLLLNTTGNTISNEIAISSNANNKIAAISGITATLSGLIRGQTDGCACGIIFGDNSNNGTLILSGGSTYSGATTISGGVLSVATGGSGSGNTNLPFGGVYINGGTLLANTTGKTIGNSIALRPGTINTIAAMSGISATLSGVISDTGGVTFNDIANTGTLTLSGANTYSGGTTISAGTLKLGNATALGAAVTGTTIASGAVLDLNGQTISNTEALTINGTGISNGGALINSNSAAASYAGLLTLGSASSIIGGAGRIAIGNVGTITGANFGLTLGGAQGGTIASIIGTTGGAVTKVGAGIWILSGANTYTGNTVISSGSLQIGNGGTSGALASSSDISIASGATLAYKLSTSTTSLTNTISGAGTISNIVLGTTLNLSGATLTGFGAGTYQVNVDETSAQPTYAKITLGSNPSLGGNTFKVMTTGYQSSFTPFDVFSWTGTATGTPTLNMNGVTVSSGSSGSGGTLTYYATSGVMLSASNKTNDVVTDSATTANSTSGSTYSNVNKLPTTSLSADSYQDNNLTDPITPSDNTSGLVVNAGALQRNLIIEFARTQSRDYEYSYVANYEVTNNSPIAGAINDEIKSQRSVVADLGNGTL